MLMVADYSRHPRSSCEIQAETCAMKAERRRLTSGVRADGLNAC
jgi:hypothetical protein